MAKLEVIEGIGPHYAAKLRAAGVRTTDALLGVGATPRGRQDLAQKTGIGDEYIMDWVNRADLMRIKGIGEEYSDLLEKAGVDTVIELARRNAYNLHPRLLQVNDVKRLVRRPPTMRMVADWISQARRLPRVISY
jgi:predicted flap endonuclease-1-like 5' DNA nuclease